MYIASLSSSNPIEQSTNPFQNNALSASQTRHTAYVQNQLKSSCSCSEHRQTFEYTAIKSAEKISGAYRDCMLEQGIKSAPSLSNRDISLKDAKT